MKIESKLISLAAATLLVASMSGCDGLSTNDSKTLSTTTSTTQHIENPKGSVTGLVQDTNGNPLAGVNVYLAGETTTTDAGGQYRFTDIPVTNTKSQAGDTGHQALSVTIAAPAGYIGATVTVTPMAQLDNAETDGAANGVETFVDGYIASAGVAVLPATNSTVNGVLRDAATGEALANKTVNFEFTVGGTAGTIAQEQEQNGVTTSYAVSTYTATTNTDGSFSFDALPTDSEFKLLIPGYTTNTIFTTNDEDVVTLGNVQATAIVAHDDIRPFVTMVNGVITDGPRALLNDDTRNTFVVNFSETLDSDALELAGNSLLLYAGSTTLSSIPFTASIDDAKKAITITTSAVLHDGDKVDILFLNADTVDTSGNLLSLNGAIGYDSVAGNYTKLQLQIFVEANTNAQSVTGTSQLAKDELGLDDDEAVQAKSDAFADVLDENTGFQQLNSADAEARLNELAQALGAAGTTVSQSRIEFTPSVAYAYLVSVADHAGNAKPQGNIDGVVNATTTNVMVESDFSGTATAMIKVSDVNPVEIYLSNVAPRDVVTITPMDSLAYTGTPSIVTLKDNVPPTTVLQKSYYAGGATSGDNSSGTVVQFGDGGELADANGGLTVGTPYLAINNSLLDNLNAGGKSVSTGVNPDQTLKKELYESSVVDALGTGLIYLDGAAAYDAQAIKAFNTDAQLGRKMGVAFSENVDLNSITPVFSGTTPVNGWTVNNDVTTNVSGQTVDVDLIDMDVSNVMRLANTDHLTHIQYAGIKDEAGNAASNATNAAVVIKDEMAPLVLSAAYNVTSANVVITFNEPIELTDAAVAPAVNSVVTLNGASAVYSATAVANQWSLNAEKTVLTIPFGGFNAPINNGTFWAAGGFNYAYPDDNYGVGVTTALDHRLMDFSAISDVHHNSWDSYGAKTGARAVENPRFATAQITSIFGANTPTFGSTDTVTNTQTVTWSFTHPVRVSDPADIFYNVTPNSAGEYFLNGEIDTDLAKILDAFTGQINPPAGNIVPLTNGGGDTSLKLSADKKTLTLKFRTDTIDLQSGSNDIVRLNTKSIVSEGDTDQSLTTAGLKANAS